MQVKNSYEFIEGPGSMFVKNIDGTTFIMPNIMFKYNDNMPLPLYPKAIEDALQDKVVFSKTFVRAVQELVKKYINN